MHKTKYWCDVCKEETDSFDIRKKITLPNGIVGLTGEFIKTSFTVKTKEMDVCYTCLNKIIKKIKEVIGDDE